LVDSIFNHHSFAAQFSDESGGFGSVARLRPSDRFIVGRNIGGMHFDGLGDTADGLFSHRPKERILEIMKDSRVGTNAVLAMVLAIVSDVFLIAQIPAGAEKYARQDGLAHSFVDCCGNLEIVKG
jgi:hypothetical protein